MFITLIKLLTSEIETTGLGKGGELLRKPKKHLGESSLNLRTTMPFEPASSNLDRSTKFSPHLFFSTPSRFGDPMARGRRPFHLLYGGHLGRAEEMVSGLGWAGQVAGFSDGFGSRGVL